MPEEASANRQRELVNTGVALARKGMTEEAAERFEQAVALNPRNGLAHYNLGLARMAQGRIDDAVPSYRRALELDSGHTEADVNLGMALVRLGRVDEAIVHFKRALARRPGFFPAFYNLGLALLYADTDPSELLAWHRRMAEQYEAPFRDHEIELPNPRKPERRLKVGYVSPDFRRHSVARFIEPVLDHHDQSSFEVHCYYNHTVRDEVTGRIAALADHWVPCQSLSDEQMAARIRADGIDILVDLTGHMRGNRLRVFARRAAPVQVSYLGYPATTGLTSMDYRLVSADTDPPGQEAWHSEELYRLPRSLWCYRPPRGTSSMTPPDAPESTGAVTFASMNNLAKVSSRTLATWAQILRLVPDARLVMTGVGKHAGRADLRRRFQAQGADPERLVLHDRLPQDDYRKLLGRIDIALDPFPYNGTTTTCESLWAGVPVVTLTGETSAARSGYALLKCIGLTELAAADEEAYVATAAELANDPQRLRNMRADLHQRLETSVLRDEAGFTRDLESAYRTMWRRWCSGEMETRPRTPTS